jgi:hypothetical protein
MAIPLAGSPPASNIVTFRCNHFRFRRLTASGGTFVAPARRFGGAAQQALCISLDVDGMTMNAGLNSIVLTDLAKIGGGASVRPEEWSVTSFRPRSVWLPAVLIAGLAGCMLLYGYAGHGAEGEPARLATVATEPAPSPAAAITNAVQDGSTFDPATSEAITPAQAAPVDGLKISSQSWRRGGLGSKALVTLTLRNRNDYAVKNIELFCSFARRDGSHLTDRTRVIPDVVNMKSRKTFARMHVGFININADRAKCSLVAASHI